MKKFRYGFLLSAIIGCLLMSASALAASKVWVPTVSTDYSIFDEGATLKTESRVFSFNNSGWVTKTGNRKYTWKNSTLKKITDLNTGRTTSFSYDKKGLLKKIIDYRRGVKEQYTYTWKKNVATVKLVSSYKDNRVKSYKIKIDEKKRMSSAEIIYKDGTKGKYTYQYYSNNNLKTYKERYADGSSRVSKYNKNGFLISRTSYDASGSITYVSKFKYFMDPKKKCPREEIVTSLNKATGDTSKRKSVFSSFKKVSQARNCIPTMALPSYFWTYTCGDWFF